MTIGVSIVHFVIKVPKFVQMIVTIYRVLACQLPIVNPRWPPIIQDGRHQIQFFDISTSDRGDFPRIIVIALFYLYTHTKNIILEFQSFRLNGVARIEKKYTHIAKLWYYLSICFNVIDIILKGEDHLHKSYFFHQVVMFYQFHLQASIKRCF